MAPARRESFRLREQARTCMLRLEKWAMLAGCTALMSGSAVTFEQHGLAYASPPEPRESALGTSPKQASVVGKPRSSALGDGGIGQRSIAEPIAFRSTDAERDPLSPDEIPARTDGTPLPGSDESWGGAYRQITAPNHPGVSAYLGYLSSQSAGRHMFNEWMARARSYSSMIWLKLDHYGLPRELLAVALIESGLDPDAVSPAGATGMWQFIPETARRYGLTVTESFDERRDPERATDAAARYLRDLFDRYKDWAMALAAYNVGEQGIDELALDAGSEDFWVISELSDQLPEETRNYVPKVLATVALLSSPTVHGFPELQPGPAPKVTRVRLPNGTPLDVVARVLGIQPSELRRMNPAIRSSVVTESVTGVVVPTDRLRIVSLLFAAPGQEGDAQTVRRLSGLPARGFSLSRARCFPGGCDFPRNDKGLDRLQEALDEIPESTYRVREGDTLCSVSRLLGVDPERLQRDNSVRDPTSLQVGQLLRVARPPELSL